LDQLFANSCENQERAFAYAFTDGDRQRKVRELVIEQVLMTKGGPHRPPFFIGVVLR
jgi:hypothetical protein